MKSVALSTFDSVQGPVVHFFVTDGFVSEALKEEISSMINFKASKDYFIVRVDQITCYNKQFTIRASMARGKVEMLMISLVTDRFPTKRAETYFLKEAEAFITFMHGESYAELVFHLEREYKPAEFQVVEQIYEKTLQGLTGIIEGFV